MRKYTGSDGLVLAIFGKCIVGSLVELVDHPQFLSLKVFVDEVVCSAHNRSLYQPLGQLSKVHILLRLRHNLQHIEELFMVALHYLLQFLSSLLLVTRVCLNYIHLLNSYKSYLSSKRFDEWLSVGSALFAVLLSFPLIFIIGTDRFRASTTISFTIFFLKTLELSFFPVP